MVQEGMGTKPRAAPDLFRIRWTPKTSNLMQNEQNNNGNTGYASVKTNPAGKDSFGLTPGQRTFAWVALAAGVLALVIGMMRSTDNATGYDTSSDNRQNTSTSESGH